MYARDYTSTAEQGDGERFELASGSNTRFTSFVITAKASHWLTRWGKAPAAGLMLFLWLWSFTLAISPQLHEWLHSDSNAPEHHCVVTQIQQNQLLAGAAVVAAIASVMFVGLVCWGVVEVFSAPDRRLSPSRAPPSCFSPQLNVG